MDLLFFTAVGLSVAAVTPLALPLIRVARGAPVSPTGVSQPGAETSVEQSVRGRLYGDRRKLPTGPIRRTALPASHAGRRRYRLLEQLGAGGMAAVYRARDERLRRDVAVKLIAEWLMDDPGFVDRFHREAELAARLEHQNVVAVLDAGKEPREFIVMELVEGTDAGTLLRAERRLTPAQTVHIIAQVCEALSHAHDRGVVHCDVSPSNILLRQSDGMAKLADFGLSSTTVDEPVTRPERVVATPGYTAPELLAGEPPSPCSDIYSLGAVVYRLLGGPPPLRQADESRVSVADVRPDLPDGLIAPVEQAMAEAPRTRQDSVAELRAQLIAGLGVPVRTLQSSVRSAAA